ncbi:MAG: bacteriorhodopsin [Candidatus Poseidoniaceae archaeon]|nr:bacteriorhodopsin [Candidatus Poseidoniaceae archaeon]
MSGKKNLRRTALLLTAMAVMAVLVPSVIAADASVNEDTGLPAFLSDEKGNDSLELLTFFLFFVGYISMGAAFVFFMSERNSVAPEYRTTMTISALIVGIAAFHYYYMRGVYVDTQVVSTEYRYMDWIITVPLMALKFPSLVGKDAITDNKFAGLGFTGICFVGAIIMIGFGYLGEANIIENHTIALLLGGMGWAMILVATGLPFGLYDGLGVDNSKIKEEVKWSTDALRTFILVGWIIYPIGYLFNENTYDLGNEEIMGVLYNIADLINKIGFGVVAWMGAKKATAAMA